MNTDTVELLKECNSGIKMGVSSIDDVLPHVEDRELSEILINSKEEHEKLGNETHLMLGNLGKDGMEPNPIAKTMSKIKTGLKMSFDDSDSSICEIIDQGCSMGIRSIRKYLDKYESAEDRAKDIADKLIEIEEKLSRNIKEFI